MTKKTTKPDLTALNLKATNDEDKNMAVNFARNVAVGHAER